MGLKSIQLYHLFMQQREVIKCVPLITRIKTSKTTGHQKDANLDVKLIFQWRNFVSRTCKRRNTTNVKLVKTNFINMP